MKRIFSYTITAQDSDQRIYDFLCHHGYSRHIRTWTQAASRFCPSERQGSTRFIFRSKPVICWKSHSRKNSPRKISFQSACRSTLSMKTKI